MLLANPLGHLATPIQTRTLYPPHRVLDPYTFLHQILSHAPHLAGHARHCGLGTKAGPAADVIDEHQPFDLLQVQPGSPPLHPATPTIQLDSYAEHGSLTQPP